MKNLKSFLLTECITYTKEGLLEYETQIKEKEHDLSGSERV